MAASLAASAAQVFCSQRLARRRPSFGGIRCKQAAFWPASPPKTWLLGWRHQPPKANSREKRKNKVLSPAGGISRPKGFAYGFFLQKN